MNNRAIWKRPVSNREQLLEDVISDLHDLCGQRYAWCKKLRSELERVDPNNKVAAEALVVLQACLYRRSDKDE